MFSTIKAFFYVLVLSLLTFTINAQLAGTWPTLDKPPQPKAEWTSLVDMSKVPNAPIVKVVGQNCPATDTYCNWSCTGCVRNDSDIVQCPSKTDWGLTFDDGPTTFTTGLLDYFDTTQERVSFFIVGSRVVENPQILQREVKAGHQIAIHTWSHTALTTQTNEEIIAELKWTELVIKTATGLTPRYMRPPYGDYDDRVRAICTQLGYKIVIWDKDTNDWTSADDPTFNINWIEGNFTQWVKENDPTGHISLEHDLYKQTAAQGPKAAQIVAGAGFSIKPVAQCVGDPYPYLESANYTTAPAAAPPASTNAYPSATVSASNPPGQVDYNDPTSSSTSTSNTPASSTTTPTTSNAISHMKNNYYLSSLVFFIVLFLII